MYFGGFALLQPGKSDLQSTYFKILGLETTF